MYWLATEEYKEPNTFAFPSNQRLFYVRNRYLGQIDGALVRRTLKRIFIVVIMRQHQLHCAFERQCINYDHLRSCFLGATELRSIVIPWTGMIGALALAHTEHIGKVVKLFEPIKR